MNFINYPPATLVAKHLMLRTLMIITINHNRLLEGLALSGFIVLKKKQDVFSAQYLGDGQDVRRE